MMIFESNLAECEHPEAARSEVWSIWRLREDWNLRFFTKTTFQHHYAGLDSLYVAFPITAIQAGPLEKPV
jgi:hypothetical protein